MPIHEEMLSIIYTWAIGLGIVVSAIVRTIMLMMDYRQIPTYPDGQLVHLSARFIATTLGAVAIPALLEKDCAAFTFLALMVQHFRDIHKVEQESLNNLELSGYARHGDAYIDGISKTYEARNYILMISSMIASSVVLPMKSLPRALAVITTTTLGMLSVFLLKRLTHGKRMGDICVIQQGKIQTRGSSLFVDNAYATGVVGPPVTRGLFPQQGPGVVITPKKEQFRTTLGNAGQRRTTLCETASALGVKIYQYVKQNMEQDKMAIALVPVDRGTGRMIAAIQNAPVLENSRKVRRTTPH